MVDATEKIRTLQTKRKLMVLNLMINFDDWPVIDLTAHISGVRGWQDRHYRGFMGKRKDDDHRSIDCSL